MPAPASLRGGATAARGVEKSLAELGAAPGPTRPSPLPAGAGLLGAVGNVVSRPDRDHAPAVGVEGKLPESWKCISNTVQPCSDYVQSMVRAAGKRRARATVVPGSMGGRVRSGAAGRSYIAATALSHTHLLPNEWLDTTWTVKYCMDIQYQQISHNRRPADFSFFLTMDLLR